MNSIIHVLIIEHDTMFCQAIRSEIESAADLAVIGQAQDVQAALAVTGKKEPQVVVFGARNLGCPEMRIVSRLCRQYPRSKVMVLSSVDHRDPLVLELFRRGVYGYLNRHTGTAHDLQEAVRLVAKGKAVLDPQITGWMIDELQRLHWNQNVGQDLARAKPEASREP